MVLSIGSAMEESYRFENRLFCGPENQSWKLRLLRSWVGGIVSFFEALFSDVGVDLSGRERGMAE